MVKYFTSICAVLLFAFQSFANDDSATIYSRVERLSVADGLPTSAVYSLVTDNVGYLWLGTPKGLVRFDGNRFLVFSNDSNNDFDIATTDASNLFVDSKGRYWMGTWGKGLYVYDNQLNFIQQFKYSPDDEKSLGSNKVQVVFEDSKGRIWVGSNGGGLALFHEEQKNFTSFTFSHKDQNTISHDRVWTIAEDADGRIWAGTTNGLNILENEQYSSFKRFYHDPLNPKSLTNSLIRKIHKGYDGRMWVGTEDSFGEFNANTEEFDTYRPPNSVINAGITAIREDKFGALWIGTQKGLYRFSPKTNQFTPLGSSSVYPLLGQDDLRDIRFDKSGILWVATRYGGLAKVQFKPGYFQPFTEYVDSQNNVFPITGVFSVYNDSRNTLWLGTTTRILTKAHNSSLIKPLDLPGSEEITTVRGFAEDAKGQLWLASEAGLFVISRNRKEITKRNDLLEGLNSPGVNKVYFDSNGAMWLGLKLEGVLRYHHGKRHHFRNEPEVSSSLSYDAIANIFEDRQNRIWISTNGGGLNQYVPLKQRFIRFQHNQDDPQSLADNNVYSLTQSTDGTIWIATESGLNRFNETKTTFERFSTQHGLANPIVRSVLEDTQGKIWLSTDNGISEFRLDHKHFVNYSLKNNLHGLEFASTASWRFNNGKMLFGGRGGFTIVDPEAQSTDSKLPNVTITQISIDREKVKQTTTQLGNRIVLPPNVRDIRIDFATLDFVNPKNNSYQYRLIGFDSNWSPISNDTYTRYTGLSDGEYTFEVKGSNSAGLWASKPTQFSITISAPWWKKLWVQGIAILVLVMLVAAWNRIRTSALKKQKAELELEVEARSNELLEAQKQLVEAEKHQALSGLVAGVAHEINTPVGISVTAASTLEDVSRGLRAQVDGNQLIKEELLTKLEQIEVSTDIILRNLYRADELIRSFKEVAIDQVSDEKRNFDLNEYIHEIVLSVGPQLKKKNIDISVSCPPKIALDSYPGAIAQILTNLLINALTHAFDEKKKGRISIQVTDLDENIKMEVSDNGNGIPESILGDIFNPFFTTKRGKGGSGLGLHIIQNLVSVRLKGRITCDSQEGVGTRFKMEFMKHPD